LDNRWNRSEGRLSIQQPPDLNEDGMKNHSVAALALLGFGLVGPAFAAPAPVPGAVDVAGAQIRAMLAAAPPRSIDRLTKSVDIGPYVVSVNVQHRVPGSGVGGGRGDAPVRHRSVTEIYYVLSGSGAFVTGSAMKDAVALDRSTPISPNGENAAGPGDRGAFDGPTVTRTLVAGDVVFVPPTTPHLLKDSDGAFDYLVFRVDPDHVIPAPFTSADLK
jgi:mannose-6-phosphate isomerase-like protein (cupin superfamily)